MNPFLFLQWFQPSLELKESFAHGRSSIDSVSWARGDEHNKGDELDKGGETWIVD